MGQSEVTRFDPGFAVREWLGRESPQPAPRRVRVRIGCVLGAAVLMTACSGQASSSREPTFRPAPRVSAPWEPRPSVPAPIVSDDPLGLLADGWTRTQRSTYDHYVVDDAFLCQETIDWLAKGFLSFTREVYLVPGTSDGRIEIAYIDYGDGATAARRLSGLADAEAVCEIDESAEPVVGTAATIVGAETFGYVKGDQQTWVVHAGDGLAVLLSGASLKPEMHSLLSERAARWVNA